MNSQRLGSRTRDCHSKSLQKTSEKRALTNKQRKSMDFCNEKLTNVSQVGFSSVFKKTINLPCFFVNFYSVVTSDQFSVN